MGTQRADQVRPDDPNGNTEQLAEQMRQLDPTGVIDRTPDQFCYGDPNGNTVQTARQQHLANRISCPAILCSPLPYTGSPDRTSLFGSVIVLILHSPDHICSAKTFLINVVHLV